MTEFKDILPLLERGYAVGLKDRHVQDLLGIATGTFSRAKNGIEPLSAQLWLDCKNLIEACEELARRSPLPISWTDLRAVRRQLDALEVERQNPPKPLTAQESQCLARFASGSDIGDLAIDAQMSKAEFLLYVEELLWRSVRIAALAKQQVAVESNTAGTAVSLPTQPCT